jgi:hypothetical protein
LIPELVTDVRNQVRLDSLFREVVRLFSHPFCDHWNSEPVRYFKEEFDKLCDPSVDDCQLSSTRLDLMRAFMAEIKDESFWDMDRIRRDFITFDKKVRTKPTWPEEMAVEDLDALRSLAD